jgi:hypothetical protein
VPCRCARSRGHDSLGGAAYRRLTAMSRRSTPGWTPSRSGYDPGSIADSRSWPAPAPVRRLRSLPQRGSACRGRPGRSSLFRRKS